HHYANTRPERKKRIGIVDMPRSGGGAVAEGRVRGRIPFPRPRGERVAEGRVRGLGVTREIPLTPSLSPQGRGRRLAPSAPPSGEAEAFGPSPRWGEGGRRPGAGAGRAPAIPLTPSLSPQ